MKDLVKSFKFLYNYKVKFSLGLLLLILMLSSTLISPKLVEYAIDSGIKNNNQDILLFSAIGIILTAIFFGLFKFLSYYLFNYTAESVGFDLRNLIFEKIMSFSNLDNWRSGELHVRLNNDVTTIVNSITNLLIKTVESLLFIIGGIIMMFLTDIKLAIKVIWILPVFLILLILVSLTVRKLVAKIRIKEEELSNKLLENFAGAKLIKSLSREQYESKSFDITNTQHYKISLKRGYIFSLLVPFTIFFGHFVLLVTLWFGGIAVIEENMAIGKLIAFNTYAVYIVPPTFLLMTYANFLSSAYVSAQRINQFLETEKPIAKNDCKSIDSIKNIEFKDITFHYGNGENALTNINIKIKQGEKIGIIGSTGSGKSSLALLMQKLYESTDGKILINDIDIKDLSIETLRTRIALVLQDTMLFSGTIRDNLTFGNRQASNEDIENALKISQAKNFILEKENLLEQEIGEKGIGLSGGQKQRISIARAIISNPDILILDDATSSVDPDTERKIMDNIYNLGSNKTVIVISQKIDVIKKAPKIIVMHKGEIISVGNHEHLITNCEIYKKMSDTQIIHI